VRRVADRLAWIRVPRELHAADLRLMTGYVEAVATLPSRQGRGHGSTVMRAIGENIDRTFQLGALDTGIPDFFGPLRWFVWKRPTFVRIDRRLRDHAR